MLEQSGCDGRAVDDRKSPSVEFDPLGEHFGTDASPVAGDRVEDQLQSPLSHARRTTLPAAVRPGTGNTRVARV